MKALQSIRNYTPEEKQQLIKNLDIEGMHTVRFLHIVCRPERADVLVLLHVLDTPLALLSLITTPRSRTPHPSTRRMARRRARKLSAPSRRAHLTYSKARSWGYHGRVCRQIQRRYPGLFARVAERTDGWNRVRDR